MTIRQGQKPQAELLACFRHAFRGGVPTPTFLQSSCEVFTQQLLLNGGNQRFPGGGGEGRGGARRDANVTDRGLSRHVTLQTGDRHSLSALV